MITPSFHFEILRGFVETFAEQADVLVSLLRKEADTGKCECAASARRPWAISCALGLLRPHRVVDRSPRGWPGAAARL